MRSLDHPGDSEVDRSAQPDRVRPGAETERRFAKASSGRSRDDRPLTRTRTAAPAPNPGTPSTTVASASSSERPRCLTVSSAQIRACAPSARRDCFCARAGTGLAIAMATKRRYGGPIPALRGTIASSHARARAGGAQRRRWVIYLSQVASGCACGRSRLSGLVRGAVGLVPRRGGLLGLPGVAALAGGVPLPALCESVGVAAEQWSVGVLGVRSSGFGHGGDDVRSHADAAANVVRRGMAADQPEAGRVGARGAACPGAWLLPDGVGDAESLSDRDGAARPRASGRPGRGR